MKNIKPFGPSIGITKISRRLINKLNNQLDKKSSYKQIDYSSKLASQIKNEILLSKKFVEQNISSELKKIIKNFLFKENVKNIKDIKIKSLWIVRQFKNDYNPIHYHNGDISGVGYLKIPKNLTKGNKKIKTNGTIDFIHGSKSFLNKSIYNHVPKLGDLILFPNYLMHTAYPFKQEGERRSFSFNLEVDKKISNIFND